MASATVMKSFSAQLSPPPTLSAMLFGISSFCADVDGATRIRLAKTMKAVDFMAQPPFDWEPPIVSRHCASYAAPNLETTSLLPQQVAAKKARETHSKLPYGITTVFFFGRREDSIPAI